MELHKSMLLDFHLTGHILRFHEHSKVETPLHDSIQSSIESVKRLNLAKLKTLF